MNNIEIMLKLFSNRIIIAVIFIFKIKLTIYNTDLYFELMQ